MRKRTTAAIRQRDITKALKGAIAGGLAPGRVEVDGCKVVIYAADASPPQPATPLERWRATHGQD